MYTTIIFLLLKQEWQKEKRLLSSGNRSLKEISIELKIINSFIKFRYNLWKELGSYEDVERLIETVSKFFREGKIWRETENRRFVEDRETLT